MNDHRFDSLVKTVSSGNSRRELLRTLGAGALAAVVGRLGPQETAESRKKKGKNTRKKRCKGNTKKCGKKACCRADQQCVGGTCEAKGGGADDCQSNADCVANAVCQNGICVPAPECVGTGACGSDPSCITLPGIGGGGFCTRGFLPGAVCGGCTADFQCAELEELSVCVSPLGAGCPCEPNQGICARRCPIE